MINDGKSTKTEMVCHLLWVSVNRHLVYVFLALTPQLEPDYRHNEDYAKLKYAL